MNHSITTSRLTAFAEELLERTELAALERVELRELAELDTTTPTGDTLLDERAEELLDDTTAEATLELLFDSAATELMDNALLDTLLACSKRDASSSPPHAVSNNRALAHISRPGKRGEKMFMLDKS